MSGILDGKGQRIAEMTASKAEQLIDQGIITDGMIVKVNAALDAARALGRPVGYRFLASCGATAGAV